MRSGLLAIMVFLVILLALNSVLAPKVREHFQIETDEVFLKSLNLCGRNVSFPYFSRNKFTASQRALVDVSQAATTPPGVCGAVQINGLAQESHSIVQENSLFYNLKTSCMALRANAASIDENKGRLAISFATRDEAEARNFSRFALLNPLYVEFVFGSERSSVAYRIAQPLSWSDAGDRAEAVVRFEQVSKKNSKGAACDKLFDYAALSPRNVEPTKEDFESAIEAGHLNVSVYYLDPVESSIQTVGRSMQLSYDGRGVAKVFEKDYKDKYYKSDYHTHVYEFMNNVALMYARYTYPIFTFKLALNVTARDRLSSGATLIVAKAHMNNSIGAFSSCPGSTDELKGQKNYNVFAIGLSGVDDAFYELHVFTGAANKCNVNSPHKLTLRLPYLSINNNVNLTFTVSPNEKLALASWQDANSGILANRFAFAKKSECPAHAHDPCSSERQAPGVASSLLEVFTRKNRDSPEDIDLRYSPAFVKKLGECHLGYVNFLKEYLVQ